MKFEFMKFEFTKFEFTEEEEYHHNQADGPSTVLRSANLFLPLLFGLRWTNVSLKSSLLFSCYKIEPLQGGSLSNAQILLHVIE